MNPVRNIIPAIPRVPRVAFIGECPDPVAAERGHPLAGPPGYFLRESLKQIHLSHAEVFYGNVCQYRAPGDKPKAMRFDSPQVMEGISQLRIDLTAFQPQLVVALGAQALRALTGEKHSIDAWKNTLFRVTLPCGPVKCLAMFNPADVMRDDSLRFFWHHQLNRLEEEMQTAELQLPQRDIRIYTDYWQARDLLHALRGRRLAWDIEGYATSGATCMSFSPSPWEAHVIPFRRLNHAPVFSDAHESRLWEEFAALVDSYQLYEPFHALTKAYVHEPDRSRWVSSAGAHSWADYRALHRSRPGLLTWNGLYDCFVLAYKHGINPVHTLVDDGMVMYWELYSEVDKSLADATSFLTREPYYKSERKSTEDIDFWRYNGKDTCVTYECIERMLDDPRMDECAAQHYAFNMSLLPPILFMELGGMLFDDAARRQLYRRTQRQAAALQGVLNREVGMPFPASPEALQEMVVKDMCVKSPRTFSFRTKVLKSGPRKGVAVQERVSTKVTISSLSQACEFALSPEQDKVHAIRQLLQGEWSNLPKLGAIQRAELSMLLGCHFNINAPSANQYLYDTLLLPPQYKVEEGRLTDRLTHDQDALLTLYMHACKQDKLAHARRPLKVWLLLAKALTALETLAKSPDKDMRMRCSYNHVGPGTGRFSCSTSPAGIGYNLQTVTKSHRFMFVADADCEMGQWDLKGADGWTIAAHCAAHGDTAMLDDFDAKIKPAQAVVLLMDRGDEVNRTDRAVVKQWCAALPDNWKYKAAKREIWGTCYLMGIAKMGAQITSDAYKEDGELLVVDAPSCKRIQAAVLARYPGIAKWQEQVRRLTLEQGVLQSASGHRRCFFGRRYEYKEDPVSGVKQLVINRAVWGAALSNEPQENTTFATKLALWRLYYDPENRNAHRATNNFPILRIVPLHTVHDSLVDQWHKADRDFAIAKHKEWFNNPITIAGSLITIPVAGEISPNWGMTEDVVKL